MKLRIKIWQFIIAICTVVFILRVSEIFYSIELLLKYLKLFFTDVSLAAGQLNFSLLDNFFSTALIILIPFYIYFKKNRGGILNKELNVTAAVLLLLLTFFVFAPIVSGTNPDFERDLSVTKLLPPFSKVKILHLAEERKTSSDQLSQFLELKNKVVKRSYNENIIFVDSVQNGNVVTYFQRGRAFHLPAAKVKYAEGKPFVTEKIFLLGTDELGRDIFSRLVYGARVSLFVGLGAVMITMVLGLALGFLAGFFGGWVDSSLSRFTDMLLAFPMIFLVILILALFGNSLVSVIVVLGFSGWMSLFKIVRGEVIAMKDKEYFVTAKMIGLSKYKLLTKEVLPVITASVVVNLVFQYGNVILAEAALSFLGLGTGGSYPSWGQMIETGQSYLTSAWWMIFFPGITLFITLFAANNFGREINTYFNPRIKN